MSLGHRREIGPRGLRPPHPPRRPPPHLAGHVPRRARRVRRGQGLRRKSNSNWRAAGSQFEVWCVSRGSAVCGFAQGDFPNAILALQRGLGCWRARERGPGYSPLTRPAALGLPAYALRGASRGLSPSWQARGTVDLHGSPDEPFAHLPARARRVFSPVGQAEARGLGPSVVARAARERGHHAWALRLMGEIATRLRSARRGDGRRRYREALRLATELGMRPLRGPLLASGSARSTGARRCGTGP